MNISDGAKGAPASTSPFAASSSGTLARRNAAAFLRRPAVAVSIALLLVILIGYADYATGFEVRLALLYVAPVALATWVCGRKWGFLIASLGPLTWAASFVTRHPYTHDIYFFWDCGVMATTLLLFVELLARLRSALARSDERFFRVLDGLYAAVYVTDDDQQVLFANTRLLRLLGDENHAPTVPRIAERFPVSATRAEGMPDAPIHLPFTGSEARDSVDGRWYMIQAGSIPWIDRRRAHLTVMTDITEQKRADVMQREHQAALHHTARLVSLAETATTLAHELNQPLIAIVGYNAACLRLLAAGHATAGELSDAMEKCRAQAVRAGDIIRRIRELSRRRTPTLAACDLNAIVRQVLEWMHDDLERNAVVVELNLSGELPPVRADRILLEQVMHNLVENAVDAMLDGGSVARVLSLATEIDGDRAVRVTVADRGGGFAPEMEGQPYAPFVSTKEKGLGLGLSICRSVAELHGGRLWHEARPGGGTSFHFSLPLGGA